MIEVATLVLTALVFPFGWWINRRLHKMETNCIPTIQRTITKIETIIEERLPPKK